MTVTKWLDYFRRREVKDRPQVTSSTTDYASAVSRNLDSFLSHDTKKALLLKGPWGVGKTYFWNRYIDARLGPESPVRESKYAYVSLFGLNSIEEVEQIILARTIPVRPRSEAERDAHILRKALPWMDEVPGIKEFAGPIKRLGALFLKNTLVCFDDLERLGSGLPLGELLGFVSTLKEQNGCRVVMLSNDNAIQGDSRTTFDRYHEKVFDQTVPFSPPPSDCAQIVFGQIQDYQHLADILTALPLSNIRVMRQALWLMDDLQSLLSNRHQDTVQLVRDHILMLTAFVRDESLGVDVDKLPKGSLLEFYVDQRDESDEPTKALFKRLREWGFESIDADPFVIDLLKHGECDDRLFAAVLDEVDRKYGQKDVRTKYEAMWSLYSGNFQSSKDEVLATFVAFMEHYSGWLGDKEFDHCQSVVRSLGGECKASWQDAFVRQHIVSADLKRLAVLETRTSNPELIDAIRARRDELQRGMTIIGTMKTVVDDSGWNPDMVTYLLQQPADSYREAILASSEPKLLRYLVGFGDSWKSAGAGERQVVQRLIEALEVIAKTSALHGMRAKWVLDEIRPRAGAVAPADA